MKISPFSSFRLEDFGSQREWIGTLFLPLNSILLQISQALDGQLDEDNIPTFTKVISGSNLTLPMSFQASGGLNAKQMVVAQAVKAGVPICMVGSWSQDGDTITVRELFEISASGNTALATGTKYTVALKFT